MGKANLSNVVKSAKIGVKKHAPEILIGLSIAGMITTTVMAVRATPKALMLIEEEKRRQKEEKCEAIDKLPAKDVVKVTWKCYMPAVTMGALSIASLVSASTVHARRNAALATVYSLSEAAIKEYRDKVVETIGEKKEKDVQDAIAKERIKNNPVSKNEVIITGKGKTLCYESFAGRYFESDIDKIKQGLNEANKELISQSYLSLNDLYYFLGIENSELGYFVGWRLDSGLIDIDFSSQLSEDGEPCLVINYPHRPKYDFDQIF